MLRQTLLAAARSSHVRGAVTGLPISSGIVSRFVAGETTDHAIEVTRQLVGQGLRVSLDQLGEDTHDREQANRIRQGYLALLHRLAGAGLSSGAEVSVKLSALGGALGDDGPKIAAENLAAICMAARNSGTTVTVDMEDHTTTDATLEAVVEARQDFPETGAVVQACLRRTESDCRDLAGPGSRVRLCKGAYAEPFSDAYATRAEVDLSYVRCLRVLLAGEGHPMVATHDPRLIEIAGALAARHERTRGSYEYQMLYGVRPAEQHRLAALGEQVRVYLPYGDDWYGYLMRRMAERPRNVMFFLRSLATRG